MGKACFQPTYEEAVAIAGRRIAERREELPERDGHDMGTGSERRVFDAMIRDATLVAELFGVTTRQVLDDSERESRGGLMELFGKIADLCQALVVLLLVFQVSALFRSVDRLRKKGEQLENRVDDIWRGNRGR